MMAAGAANDIFKCRVVACPWPWNALLHYCWLVAIPGHKCWGPLTHQHVKKRSQGGKTVDAIYCAGGHDQIDNGSRGSDGRRLGNDTVEIGGKRFLRVFTREGGYGEGLLLTKAIPESEVPA